MIVNERITAYINSLDRGNGSLCDEVEEGPVYSGRYKDQYNMDCCCMDARHGQSTGVGEFASGNGYESYGAIDDDKEY